VTVTVGSPLEATFARLRALTAAVEAGVRDVDGRVEGDVVPPGVPEGERLEALLAAIGERYGSPDRRVQVLLGVHSYLFHALAPAIAGFLVDRRVPCLDPACTAVAWAGGTSPARLVVCGRFAALPGDEAADAGAATVVDGEDALRDRLEAEILGAVAPLVAALEALGGIRARTLWLAAADSVAGTSLWLGQLLGDASLGRREAERIVGRAGSPLHSPRGRFVTYGEPPAAQVVHLRATCCLSWRIGDEPDYCPTCPILDEDQRRARIPAAAG
jgi:hypothetical protein